MKNLYLLLFALICLTKNLFAQVITSPNPVICGSNTNAVLTASTTGTYQWSFCATEFGTYTNISGATSSSHITTTLGFYKVAVNSVLSPVYKVANAPYAITKNASGTTSAIQIAASGGNADLYINFYGAPPFTAILQDGGNTSSVASNTNLKIQNVSPESSRRFSVYSVSQTGCAGTGNSNDILVNVAPNPSFTFGTVATTACAGGFIQIPTTRTGNWGTSGFEKMLVSLYTSAGAYVTNLGTFSSPTMNVQIPVNVTVGNSYKISAYSYVPSTFSSFTTNFTITNSCPTPPNAIIDEQNGRCVPPILKASPIGSGYTFQWRKGGVNIAGATSENYTPTQSDNYSVVIQNSSLGYNSTSPSKSVTVYATKPTISCPNPILCGSNTYTTIISNYTGAGFTYEWRKDYAVIAGATGPSITVSDKGIYYVTIVNNIGCSSQSNEIAISYTASGTLLNSNNTNDNVFLVSPQTTENLKVNLIGTGPWEVGLSDGNTVRTYTANTSPLIIPVSPTSQTNYSLTYVSSNCGVNKSNTGNVSVGIAPAPTISFPTPSNLTICRGNTINVPYTVTGNLGNKLNLGLLLGDATGGEESRYVYTYIGITLDPLQTSGTIPIYIPNDLSLGSYSILFVTEVLKLGISGNGIWTNYALNVVNTGCSATPAPTITGPAIGCGRVVLQAMPFNGFGGSANTHQWYKNGVIMAGKTFYQLDVYDSGNYTVQVINGAYNQTSTAKTVTINRIIPTISTSNPVICGSNTSTTLSTNYTGVGYTYQWGATVLRCTKTHFDQFCTRTNSTYYQT